MRKNTTATVIKGIGIAVMVICFIAALIVGGETSNEMIPTLFIVSGFISGVTFIGFGEIISLLQKNVNKQEEILNYLKNRSQNSRRSSKTYLQDIEENLPEI